MTIKQALIKAAQQLQKYNISDPPLEAELLLSSLIKKPREYLFAYPGKQLTKLQITNYQAQISHRLTGWPVAYLTGVKEFYGYEFQVNKNVLIPRPESELLLEAALKIITEQSLRPPRQNRNMPLTIIDIGTGSGCIIVSLIKQIQYCKLPITNYKFLANDISKSALLLARKNAKLHKVNKKIKFLNGNLLEPIIKLIKNKSAIGNLQSKILILANLPYLTPAQIKKSPAIKREPKLALAAGPDGLKYYRRLFKQIKLLPKTNLPIACLIEFDPDQTKKLKQLVSSELPLARLIIKKDLAGRNRLADIMLRSVH